ncbi:hypothetical protein EVAR_38505_1 [Eumeta japonica]|uniref:Uncharacterized protein n=1 Tax=Eumeta variegata TaxID=151549 RepID=A0A4C1WBU9_EUMVA|nr:hypothetical protein EVAR_38505_1 [Eumeta japonica]
MYLRGACAVYHLMRYMINLGAFTLPAAARYVTANTGLRVHAALSSPIHHSVVNCHIDTTVFGGNFSRVRHPSILKRTQRVRADTTAINLLAADGIKVTDAHSPPFNARVRRGRGTHDPAVRSVLELAQKFRLYRDEKKGISPRVHTTDDGHLTGERCDQLYDICLEQLCGADDKRVKRSAPQLTSFRLKTFNNQLATYSTDLTALGTNMARTISYRT